MEAGPSVRAQPGTVTGARPEVSREPIPVFEIEKIDAPDPPPVEEAPLEYQKAAQYEKILGASTLDPDVVILLTPNQCRRRYLAPAPPTPPKRRERRSQIHPRSVFADEGLDLRWLADGRSARLGPLFVEQPLTPFDDPEPERARSPSARSAEMLTALVTHFETLGFPRYEAAAALNAGAMAWLNRDADTAYRSVMRARELFAALGDVRGIAVSYEWLGYIFERTGEAELAADHLGLAHSLYGMLGDQPAAERLSSYARQ